MRLIMARAAAAVHQPLVETAPRPQAAMAEQARPLASLALQLLMQAAGEGLLITEALRGREARAGAAQVLRPAMVATALLTRAAVAVV
jgi:hypothetical protein